MKYNYKNLEKAFTLIEMMVSISIIAVILTVTLWNYGIFNDNLALGAAAQEMAVTIRQAQTYGINVKEAEAGGGVFTNSFGIHIDPTNSPTSYRIFTNDSSVNKKYDAGESVETITLKNGVTIYDITVSDSCHSASTYRTLDVTFRRPNPDADINFVNNGGNVFCVSEPDATITLKSAKGTFKYVIIEKSGQITIQ